MPEQSIDLNNLNTLLGVTVSLLTIVGILWGVLSFIPRTITKWKNECRDELKNWYSNFVVPKLIPFRGGTVRAGVILQLEDYRDSRFTGMLFYGETEKRDDENIGVGRQIRADRINLKINYWRSIRYYFKHKYYGTLYVVDQNKPGFKVYEVHANVIAKYTFEIDLTMEEVILSLQKVYRDQTEQGLVNWCRLYMIANLYGSVFPFVRKDVFAPWQALKFPDDDISVG